MAKDRLLVIAGNASRSLAEAVGHHLGQDLGQCEVTRFTDGEVCGVPARIAHTGYTGELGYEVYVAPSEAVRVWNELLQAGAEFGVKPCGLGARNTLRLEAKMALYGHEIDDTTHALEATR